MALRGDSIDNIPGAPGIGDKGSVELIQQFGTVEAALDLADQVKKKTYRESLQNNRDNILLSKELVTIHTAVPIEFSLDSMRTQPVDNAACRALFSELEFTTLLKELAPAEDNTTITFQRKPRPEEIAQLLAEAREEGEGRGKASPSPSLKTPAPSPKKPPPNPPTKTPPSPRPAENMNLFGAPETPSLPSSVFPPPSSSDTCTLGLATSPTLGLEVPLDAPGIREALEDESLPKDVHDLKAVLRALAPHGITLRGVRDDVMLLSYLVNPTHGSHTLPDIAARATSRALIPPADQRQTRTTPSASPRPPRPSSASPQRSMFSSK